MLVRLSQVLVSQGVRVRRRSDRFCLKERSLTRREFVVTNSAD